jgi:pheromone shutdown protein TraB
MAISLFAGSGEVSEEQIEALKDRDTIAEMMTELAKHMPNLQVPLIDERDRYLMSTIQEAPGPVVVGVVGAGHVAGMVRYLGQPVDRADLNTVPLPSAYARLSRWLLPGVYIMLLAATWLRLGWEGAAPLLASWAGLVGISAGLATALLGATVTTSVAIFLLAPLTRLFPVVDTSATAAWLEARRLEPTLEQREQINDALLSLSKMRANPFVRILFVGVTAGFVTAVAAWAATAWAAIHLAMEW